MWREFTRLVLACLLAVALTTGMVARSQAALVTGDAMNVATAAMDMPMIGHCDGCAGHEKTMMPIACSAFCNTVFAIASLCVAYDPVAAGSLGPRTSLAVVGRSVPPDPYPPRPISMN